MQAQFRPKPWISETKKSICEKKNVARTNLATKHNLQKETTLILKSFYLCIVDNLLKIENGFPKRRKHINIILSKTNLQQIYSNWHMISFQIN